MCKSWEKINKQKKKDLFHSRANALAPRPSALPSAAAPVAASAPPPLSR